jgi:hypothetical protein
VAGNLQAYRTLVNSDPLTVPGIVPVNLPAHHWLLQALRAGV